MCGHGPDRSSVGGGGRFSASRTSRPIACISFAASLRAIERPCNGLKVGRSCSVAGRAASRRSLSAAPATPTVSASRRNASCPTCARSNACRRGAKTVARASRSTMVADIASLLEERRPAQCIRRAPAARHAARHRARRSVPDVPGVRLQRLLRRQQVLDGEQQLHERHLRRSDDGPFGRGTARFRRRQRAWRDRIGEARLHATPPAGPSQTRNRPARTLLRSQMQPHLSA
ncbi:hypothetical protein NB713_003937 [Xanthomonas sacchari]|nr:hypothetical protein [Xanthomonas sacchari]